MTNILKTQDKVVGFLDKLYERIGKSEKFTYTITAVIDSLKQYFSDFYVYSSGQLLDTTILY